MLLAPMKYKDFTWPHNPRTYTIQYQRSMADHKVPFGRYHLQDLGPAHRIMKGEGEFVGPDAYDTFKALAAVFYSDGPGLLIHPVWQAANVYFVELSLAQEPRPGYVRYTFTFWESYDDYIPCAREVTAAASPASSAPASAAGPSQAQAVYYTVVSGDTLWAIARRQGITLTQLIAWNPQIKNPNLIHPGEKVRVR